MITGKLGNHLILLSQMFHQRRKLRIRSDKPDTVMISDGYLSSRTISLGYQILVKYLIKLRVIRRILADTMRILCNHLISLRNIRGIRYGAVIKNIRFFGFRDLPEGVVTHHPRTIGTPSKPPGLYTYRANRKKKKKKSYLFQRIRIFRQLL